jgi:hypothetical protein
MNAFFFGGLFVSALVLSIILPPTPYTNLHLGVPAYFSSLGWPLMLLAIFLSNLALSAFLIVTLPGFVCFPASACALAYRAFLWSLLLSPLPNSAFLAVVPTVVLEGEAYVLAATAGTIVGVSWVKPSCLHTSENHSRREAFKRAIKESSEMYALIALMLFLAAGVETVAIIFGY